MGRVAVDTIRARDNHEELNAELSQWVRENQPAGIEYVNVHADVRNRVVYTVFYTTTEVEEQEKEKEACGVEA